MPSEALFDGALAPFLCFFAGGAGGGAGLLQLLAKSDQPFGGIGPAVEQHIFDPFEQADNSTQRRFGGTGLGLAISRTLCELLGYRLSAVSDVGVGSAFSVLLAPQASAPGSYAELALSYERTAQVCA